MDPITTAILAAIAADAARGVTEIGKQGIVDAYASLKDLLRQHFSQDSELIEAVEKLEQKPDSEGRKTTLQEEVKAVGVDQYPDLIEAAQALLDQIRAQPGGEQRIQNAIGHHIAQAGPDGTAIVGFTAEDVQELIRASTHELKTSYQGQVDKLSCQLDTTREALIGFLHVLNEKQVPSESQLDTLAGMARRHHQIRIYRQELEKNTRFVEFRGIPLPRDRSGRPKSLSVPLDKVYIRLQPLRKSAAWPRKKLSVIG